MTSLYLLADGLARGEYWWFLFDLPFWSAIVFGLLLVILGIFALGPMLTGLKAREDGIVRQIKEAELARQDIASLRAQHAHEREKARLEAEELIREAKRDAAKMQEEMQTRGQKEAELISNRATRDINLLRQRFAQEIWQTSADESTAIALAQLKQISRDEHLRLVDESLRNIAGGVR